MNDRIEQDLAREELTIASDSKRIAAYFLDETLIGLMAIVALWDRFAAAASSNDPIAQIVAIQSLFVSNFIWIALFHIAYHTIFVALYGATLGKMWQRIAVIEVASLSKPSFLVALTRSLTRVVSNLCLEFGFVWAFFNPLRQTWHDKISGAIVINV
ncbi:MAG: RDD family protein [Helicobacteraceae bacterium]|jgi:uncharacterized RDD family membrane protein YckC|nr:RDD family protein [Helicobacteraceae bacterium]